MVPGEYSALCMPTSSPRAWAGDDITIPAPMVTAKAAAILNDIALSIPVAPWQGSSWTTLEGGGPAGLTHAFLTASLIRPVPRQAEEAVSTGDEMKCWNQSK